MLDPQFREHHLTKPSIELKLLDRTLRGGFVSEPTEDQEAPATPLEQLRTMAAVETMLTDNLRHIEVYTMDGLLSLFWHGPSEAQDVVLACGGAMGGVLGPADALYQDLGVSLAESGVGMIRIGYRAPNDTAKCGQDLVAAADVVVVLVRAIHACVLRKDEAENIAAVWQHAVAEEDFKHGENGRV